MIHFRDSPPITKLIIVPGLKFLNPAGARSQSGPGHTGAGHGDTGPTVVGDREMLTLRHPTGYLGAHRGDKYSVLFTVSTK